MTVKNEDDKFSNREIAHLLRSIAAAYQLSEENRFKIIAYEQAADTVAHLSRELKDIWEDGRILQIPGIGPSIASHLDEYFRKGRSAHFEKVMSKIPRSVFVLIKIPTIGPKKAYKLVKSLNLYNEKTVINDLEKACLENKVAQLENFGTKSQIEILKAITIFKKRNIKEWRMVLPYAFNIAVGVINYLKKNPKIKRIDLLGSLRRMAATIGDIDIAIQIQNSKFKIQNYKEIVNYFIKFPKTVKVDNAGEKKASIIVSPNIRIDLRIQEEKNYGSMLQYFTGSKTHNIKLRQYGLKKGYSLSEYGIKSLNQKSKIKNQNYNSKLKIYQFDNEEKFYNFLGLQYIPPELREGTDEIEIAEKWKIPKLIEREDIKGDLHIHSSYDLKPSHDLGENTYEEIAANGKELGFEYVGFADHNPSTTTNSEEEIISIMMRRKEYIDKIFSTKKIERSNYFIGIEADLLPDGKIALPIKAIDYVDYIIVAVHSVFNMNIKAMTKRVLTGLNFPKVKILAHPTGRLLGKREGFELEWEKIFDFCKRNNIALEINAWPERLDLPDILVREAVNYGLKLIINTDAHQNSEMENIFYGVSVARRGWAKKSDIINTLSYKEFKKWLIG